jgi:Tol biopolymer transport system component
MMTGFRSIVVLCMASLLCVSVFLLSQSASALFEQGLFKENAEGDLSGAIAIFNRIVEDKAADPSIRAKAQLHIGMCYEKLGLREAQAAYQKVIENYPRQHEEVNAAKERISQLARVLVTAPGKPKFRKIQIPANPGNGVLSPDGKRLAFASEGSIWVVPIPGKVDPNIAGIPVRLTEPIGATNSGNTLAWSGDGKWIAFNTSRSTPTDSNSIFVVPSAGGEVKEIAIQPVGNAGNRRLSLSPDGKTLAFSDEQGTCTISVDGGRAKYLTDNSYPWGDAAFSPDGTRLAYVNSSRMENGDESNVWVVDSLGGSPVKLRTMSGIVRGPTWSPDGTMIAFIYDPKPTQANDRKICVTPVKESLSGSINSLEIELPLEPNFISAGWTSQNTIGLLLGNPNFDAIYTVPSAGGRASQVSPAGLSINHPKWSPEGKRIFFRGYGIFSIPSDGGSVATVLANREELYEATSGGGNDVSPDGKKLVFSGARIMGRSGDKDRHVEVNIYTILVEGGQPTQITAFPWDPKNPWAGQARFPCWSPDGKRIAFIRDHINEKGNHVIDIFAVPSTGGEPRQITSESHRTAWAGIDWSPDGRHIAYFSQDKTVNLLPVDGGPVKTLAKVEDINGHMELSWSPDGKKIAFSDKGKIFSVSTEGGQPVEVKTGLEAEAFNLAWSPDGKMIAFAAAKSEPAELWLMEDFLHLVKNKK